MRARRVLALAALALLATAVPAAAHEHVCLTSDGAYEERDAATRQCPADTVYHFVIGWTSEPPVQGEVNGLSFSIRARQANATETPVVNVTTATAQYEFGGRTFPLELEPRFGVAGEYTDHIKPTRPGTYTVRFGGTVEGRAINFTVQPEEVAASADLAFPEAEPDVAALQQRVATLEQQVQALQRPTANGQVTTQPPPAGNGAPGFEPLLLLAGLGAAALVARRRA